MASPKYYMNMTRGVNRGERRRTRLGTIGVSPRGALPTYIKEGEEEAGHQGRIKERGVLLGLQS